MATNKSAQFRHHLKEVERADAAAKKREERLRRKREKRERKAAEEVASSESSPRGLGRCLGKAVRLNRLHEFESRTLLVKERCGRCKHKVSHHDGNNKCSKCPGGICRYVRED